MKRNEGFTLIELVVTLVAAALVTFAAASLLLMGTRIQHASNDDMSEQQTVRIVLTLLEDMAGSGDIARVTQTNHGWQLKEENGEILFEYVSEDQSIYQGAAPADSEAAGIIPLLTNLNNAGILLNGNLMTFSFDTVSGERYRTKVYCRIGVLEDGLKQEQEIDDLKDAVADEMNGSSIPKVSERLDYLMVLLNEYADGKNTGRIQNPIKLSDEKSEPYAFYSAWYIGGYQGKDGWNPDTPWCACFVSWAAVKSGLLVKNDPNHLVFANVDAGMQAFQNTDGWQDAAGATPYPGDYIFFDWTGDRRDPSHVGVVLDVSDDTILTIEGNSSGRVAIRQYDRHSEDIMGYGTLPAFKN